MKALLDTLLIALILATFCLGLVTVLKATAPTPPNSSGIE